MPLSQRLLGLAISAGLALLFAHFAYPILF